MKRSLTTRLRPCSAESPTGSPFDLRQINVLMVPQDSQRYPTAGDYWEDGPGKWEVRISEELPDWRYQACVVIHELVEMFCTRHNGVPWEDIDKFDMEHPDLNDPGQDERAPYQKEHLFAERIEKMLATAMGIPWEDYLKAF